MKYYVLDSYALLAYFEDEPGAEKVQGFLELAEKEKARLLMCIVNWGEVYYSLIRTKGEQRANDALLVIRQLPLKLIDVDKDLMHEVARLKAYHPIALGDCFAAALALKHHCPVVTGDKEFELLKKQITIEWL